MSNLKWMLLEDSPNDAELMLAAPAESHSEAVAPQEAIDFHTLDSEQAGQGVLGSTQPAASGAAFYNDEG